MKYSVVFALCFFCCSFFLRAVFAEDFSSIDNDLNQLENLINDTLTASEAQQKQLDSLKRSLDESGKLIAGYENTIHEQESSLEALRTRLDEMSVICKAQSDLSAKYARSSKFWKIFTFIAIPAAALLSGGIVHACR